MNVDSGDRVGQGQSYQRTLRVWGGFGVGLGWGWGGVGMGLGWVWGRFGMGLY